MHVRRRQVLVVLSVVFGSQLLLPSAAHADSPTYYVDALAGSESNSGTTPEDPLKLLDGKLSTVSMPPGTTVYLQAAETYSGELVVPATVSGVTFAAATWSMSSPAPPTVIGQDGPRAVVSTGRCVVVLGDDTTISGVHAENCPNKPDGFSTTGFTIGGDRSDPTSGVTLVNDESSGNAAGVSITDTADHSTVKNSSLHDNNVMAVDTQGSTCDAPGAADCNDDYGAEGIAVEGDYSIIEGNTITGSYADSYDYGEDGSAIELFGAAHTVVIRNVAYDDLAFTELGASPDDYWPSRRQTTDTTFAYNEFRTDDTSEFESAAFLNEHASNDTFGNVSGTVAVHNSIRLPRLGTVGFVCTGCSDAALTVVGNVIDAGKGGWIDPVNAFTHHDNLIDVRNTSWTDAESWGDPSNPLATGECTSTPSNDCPNEPKWASPSVNLALQETSWAVDKIAPWTDWPTWAGSTVDWESALSNVAVPQGGNADLGAYETAGS